MRPHRLIQAPSYFAVITIRNLRPPLVFFQVTRKRIETYWMYVDWRWRCKLEKYKRRQGSNWRRWPNITSWNFPVSLSLKPATCSPLQMLHFRIGTWFSGSNGTGGCGCFFLPNIINVHPHFSLWFSILILPYFFLKRKNHSGITPIPPRVFFRRLFFLLNSQMAVS